MAARGPSERESPLAEAGDRAKPRTFWRGIGLGQVGAIFGLITAIISFVFLVDPALRPDPRTSQSASLSIVGFDQGVSLREFAGRLGQGNSDVATAPEACYPGNVAYLQVNLQGFKSRRTAIGFFTYDARTHKRVRGVQGTVSGGNPNVELTGEVTSDQSVSLQWVQWPKNKGHYFIRFEVFSGGSLLAVADSKDFQVTAEQYRKLFVECNAERNRNGDKPVKPPSLAEGTIGGGGGTDWTQVLTYVALGSAAALALVGLASLLLRIRNRGTTGPPAART